MGAIEAFDYFCCEPVEFVRFLHISFPQILNFVMAKSAIKELLTLLAPFHASSFVMLATKLHCFGFFFFFNLLFSFFFFWLTLSIISILPIFLFILLLLMSNKLLNKVINYTLLSFNSLGVVSPRFDHPVYLGVAVRFVYLE